MMGGVSTFGIHKNYWLLSPFVTYEGVIMSAWNSKKFLTGSGKSYNVNPVDYCVDCAAMV